MCQRWAPQIPPPETRRATERRARPRQRWLDWIEEVERIDFAMYAAIAGTPTPALDGAMRRLSRAADYSRVSLASAALLALTGGGPAAGPRRDSLRLA